MCAREGMSVDEALLADAELDRCERILTACTCIPAYKGRGRTDPQCDACHMGVEVIDTFRALRAEVRRLRSTAVFDMDAAVEAAINAVAKTQDEPVSLNDLPDFLVNDWRKAITAALPHLPVYREFGSDGKPFCRRSWNDGHRSGVSKANEFRDLIDPDMEALRRELESLRASSLADARDAERYRYMKANAIDSHMWTDESIDAALAAQAGKQGGG